MKVHPLFAIGNDVAVPDFISSNVHIIVIIPKTGNAYPSTDTIIVITCSHINSRAHDIPFYIQVVLPTAKPYVIFFPIIPIIEFNSIIKII